MNPTVSNPIFPSILATRFFDLQNKLELFTANGITNLHLDIMDGHFVDNLTFGPSLCQAIHDRFDFTLDAHLMVQNPGRFIPSFIRAGAEYISIHIETDQVAEDLATIRKSGCRPGLAINPDTPVEQVFPYLAWLDYLLVMSVFPGKGGQSFIPETLERIQKIATVIAGEKVNCKIQVDGGIHDQNIGPIRKAGADWFVIGTFLYDSEHVATRINDILSTLR
jgi:ribulose-phosphate 3-epimerase